jgi:hypothetical protein
MGIPRKVKSGDPITADFVNSIIDSIKESQINAFVGGSFKRGTDGTTLTISPATKTASQASQICPFDVTTALTAFGQDVSLALGTINGLMPVNNRESINTSTNGVKYVVINCESNGKNVTSASWAIQNNIPVPALATIDVAPTTFGVLVGVISGSTAYKTIPCSNIVAKVSASIQTDREEYVAGQRNYNQYYQWVF